MKYLFIFNPAAGPVNSKEKYGDAIKSVCEKNGLDYEFVLTERVGHATEIASAAADAATAENPVRIFSIGGDGTLCEVASGLIGKENCELGCIPCGSGNDYIKSFGTSADFLDFESYITSDAVAVDGIDTGVLKSINICSMGFDAIICDNANKIKEKNKKYSGSQAYDKAVIKSFFGKIYNTLKITIDGKETFEGDYLFSLAASGQYYGGGFNSAPMADPTDGQIDFVLVKRVSKLKALTLVSDYKNGSFINKKKFKKILTIRKGTHMHVESETPVIVTVDGECFASTDIDFKIMPKALRFVAPKCYLEKRA